jgi:L-ribulose-5-phosphate 3-epimerase
MQLGIVADEIDRDFAKAVALGTQLGIQRYEVRFLKSGRVPLCDRSEMLAAERCAAERDVQITALSPGLFKYVDNAADFHRELNEIYPRAAEWAKRWNLSGLIIFGFRKPGATEENGDLIASSQMPGQIIEWMARAAERAAADGLNLMIEPEPICWADTWSATLALLKAAGSKALKINYDPGNVAWVQRQDTLAEFDQLAPYIANVHIKDLAASPRGSGKPQFVIPGEGMINYRAHFSALKRAGYCGPISLEPHISGDPETIRRCKLSCESIWASSNGEPEPAR